ncbi:YdcF family protein [Shewanella aestuarii]|uniref:DUF218 domain-containing protein n=1 Tax=Shewanella aestuarii TaxID=1028752 RepID=A0A6G9QK05_9GAMM|nr:ElyC/SanA/YdcF family protein [Shewanella aestuarii]QIR14890.1 DUF218 domain-containing protein [Shewanella aestuarii]
MFLLKKIISQLFMPIPLTLLLLLVMVLLIRLSSRKLVRLAKLCFVMAILLLAGLSQSDVSYHLAKSLESQYPINSSPIRGTSHNSAAQCWVLVLGSGHNENSNYTAVQQLSTTALARLTEGLRQLSLGGNCQLVVSGWSGGVMPTPHAELMRQAAIELGVNPARIVAFPDAKDTVEEAISMYKLVGQHPFRLVTSATHMPRSMQIFESLGMQPQAAPTDFIARKSYWWRLDAEQLLTSQKSIHEYVGQLWITLKGVAHQPVENGLKLSLKEDN